MVNPFTLKELNIIIKKNGDTMKRIKEISINSSYRRLKQSIINTIFIIGIICCLYALFQSIYDYIQEQNKITIIGTVKEVQFGEKTSTIKVGYTVNRIDYIQTITTDEDVTVNDKYQVVYNKNNPALTIKNEHIIEISISLSIFAISMAISLQDFIKGLLKTKKINKYKTEGIYIRANIQEVMINTKAHKYKKHHPYIIRLSYYNPQDGQTYIYKSENIYEDIKSTIERNNTKTVDVYLNKENTNDYYIDLDSILKV